MTKRNFVWSQARAASERVTSTVKTMDPVGVSSQWGPKWDRVKACCNYHVCDCVELSIEIGEDEPRQLSDDDLITAAQLAAVCREAGRTVVCVSAPHEGSWVGHKIRFNSRSHSFETTYTYGQGWGPCRVLSDESIGRYRILSDEESKPEHQEAKGQASVPEQRPCDRARWSTSGLFSKGRK
jgi:hypothetical protein